MIKYPVVVDGALGWADAASGGNPVAAPTDRDHIGASNLIFVPRPALRTNGTLSGDIARFKTAIQNSTAFAAFCGDGDPESSVFSYWVDEERDMPDALAVVCFGEQWMNEHKDFQNTIWMVDSQMVLMFNRKCDRDDDNETVFTALAADVDAILTEIMPNPVLNIRDWKPMGPFRSNIAELHRESVELSIVIGSVYD